jgi:ABC-2 type transport system ATP-binding protein
MLQVEAVQKWYPGAAQPALDGVSFSVAPGSICCIIGRNGAGKSTLMSSIVGLTPLDAGRVTLDGASLPDSLPLRRRVGFAAQSEALYPLLSGRENLHTFGQLAGVGRSALDERITGLAGRLGIVELLDRPVRELSGGERRRVHVAAALVGGGDVIMLDEPTAGVDPVTRANVLSLVRSLAAEGAMVLYSTHYLHEVEQLDGQVVLIEQGREVASGTVASLVGAHANASVELGFSSAVDVAPLPWRHDWVDELLVVEVQNPTEDLPAILQHLGPATIHLCSLEVVEPNLDRVFLALTGRELPAGETG